MANLIEALVRSLLHAQIQVIGTMKFGCFVIILTIILKTATMNFMLYCTVGMYDRGKFGDLVKSVVTINNLLTNLFLPNFFCKI